MNVSVKAISKVRKKYGLSETCSLSSKQFLEAQMMSFSGQTKGNTKKSSRNGFSFHYSMKADLENKQILLTIEGRHISKNVYDTLPMWGAGGKQDYKKAMERASNDFRLREKNAFKKILKDFEMPFRYAKIKYVFYNHVSRDHDNNSETIKRVQDSIVRLGVLVDDSRKYLIPDGDPEEVIVKRGEPYRIAVLITALKSTP